MASRRLAISSLLCADDPDAPIAGPSSHSPPESPRQHAYSESAAHHVGSPSTTLRISPLNASGPVPFSVQYALPSRSRTPSPTIQRGPTPPPPHHRRSFKEVAFDNYQTLPVSATSPPVGGRAVGLPDHRRQRPSLPGASRTSSYASHDDPRYEPSQQQLYSPPDPSFSTHLRKTSSQDFVVLSPSAYPVQSPQIFAPSPPRSPVVSYPSSRRHPLPQTASPQSVSTYVYDPLRHSPVHQLQPSLSPIRTFHDFPLPPHHGSDSTLTSPHLASTRHALQRSSSRSKHALSSLLTQPSPPRTSAASLPHILNSPTAAVQDSMDARDQLPSAGSGMEGLEALVQAATQERKRLDAHGPEATNSRSPVSQTRSSAMSSRSEDARRSPVEYYSPHQQISPQLPSPRRLPESPHQPYISPRTSFAPLGEAARETARHSPLMATHSLQSSPRDADDRFTNESLPVGHGVILSPIGSRNVQLPQTPHPASPPHSSPQILSPLSLRSPSAPKLNLIGPGQNGLDPHSDDRLAEVMVMVSPVASVPGSAAKSAPQPPLAPSKPAGSAPEKKSSKKRKADAKDGVKVKEKAAKTSAHTEVHSSSSSAHPTRPTKARQDPDAHDWFLEQLSSTSGTSHVAERPPSPRRKVAHSTSASRAKGPPTAADIRPAKSATKDRSPTPLEMLVAELDSKPFKPAPSKTSSSRAHKPAPSDLDSELDFVVGSSSTKQESQPMDTDVDDELMRLLDGDDDAPRDKPQDRPQPMQPSKKSSVVPEHRPGSKHATAATLTEEAVSTPGVASVKHSPMPPPASPSISQVGDGKATPVADVTKPSAKTKDGGTKKKTAPKTKTKHPAPKAKPKTTGPRDGSSTPIPSPSIPASTPNEDASPSVPAIKGKKSGNHLTAKRAVSALAGGASRSRSTSVMPGTETEAKSETKKGSRLHEEEKDGSVDAADLDDKLYCVCKTSYDEDRVMIACDRCDEWYHTQCVDMPDLEVDLVDQFICPICISNNPHLSLRTTYKLRCMAGLKHPRPQSPGACHKPARGAFSKFCSDECGVRSMKQRLEAWSGSVKGVWEGVKGVARRESVVYRCIYDDDQQARCNGDLKQEPVVVLPVVSPSQRVEVVKPRTTKADRERVRLHAQLDKISARRDELKEDENIVVLREQIWDLASRRADQRGDCGFDMRMCWADDEVREYGEEVFASYEAEEDAREDRDEDRMAVDGAADQDTSEWWCKGKKKCERHAGWQKLRQAEIELDREFVDSELDRLTARERDIRKRVEDCNDASRNALSDVPASFRNTGPLQPLNGTVEDLVGMNPLDNGVGLGLSFSVNGVDDHLKKGKKRKVEERHS